MILLVEDNAEVAGVFAEAVRAAGYEVRVCGRGAEAKAALAAGRYDLVLMDLSLPDINGAEIARQARAGGDTTPMIAVSGALQLIDPALLAAAGFVDALEKPCRVSALVALIGRHTSPAARP